MISRSDGAPLSQSDQQQAQQLAADLGDGSVPGVSSATIGPQSLSKDGKLAVIAVLPLLLIGIVYTAARGLTATAAGLFDFQVSSSLDAILVVVLFGVGADYIVFLLFRHREELRAGREPRDAIGRSTTIVGEVVASSALTVVGAFAVLSLAKLGSLWTMAPGLVVSVLLMLVTALTAVPAIFVILGRNLFWPWGLRDPGPDRVSERVAGTVSTRPLVVVVLVIAILAVFTAFAPGYKPTYDTLSELPSDTPSQQTYNQMAGSFPQGAESDAGLLRRGCPDDPAAVAVRARRSRRGPRRRLGVGARRDHRWDQGRLHGDPRRESLRLGGTRSGGRAVAGRRTFGAAGSDRVCGRSDGIPGRRP